MSSVEDSVDASGDSVEVSPQTPVEASVETSPQTSIEASVETSPQTSVETSPPASVEAAPEISVAASVEAPVEAVVEAVVDAAVETLVEVPVEASVESSVEASVEAPADASVESSLDTSVEAPVEAPANALSQPYPLTQPTCAARDDNGRACDATPLYPCTSCFLVSYCDPVCQERHWPEHKLDCTKEHKYDSLAEDLDSQGGAEPTASFWSSYAATDLLNLEKNEGRYFDGTLSMLIAGTSPFRHFIYSLLKVPKTASPTLKVSMNAVNLVHMLRDFYAIHLLFDRDHDPYLNAEAVIHLWYSTKLPQALWDHVVGIMKVVFSDFDESMVGAKEERAGDMDAADLTLPLGWINENVQFLGNFFAPQWDMLKFLITQKTQPTPEEASKVQKLDQGRHCEPLSVAATRMTHARTLGLMKWREDGMMLPFGHPRDGFDKPNPIFFQADGTFPAGATNEPLGEWPMEFLDFPEHSTKNDAYGKMFYYLRDMLIRFQEESKRINIVIELASFTIPQLVHRLHPDVQYDRILMGELWDFSPACTLAITAASLRHHHENPFSTMLALSRQTVTHTDKEVSTEEGQNVFGPSSFALDEYVPPIANPLSGDMRNVIRRRIGLLMWRNWDRYSDEYLHDPNRFAFHLFLNCHTKVDESVFKTGFLGTEYKEKNTITRRWPNRLIYSKSDKPGIENFDRHLGWSDLLPQRWLEWKRVGDADDDDWWMWSKIVLETTWEEMIGVQKRLLEKRERLAKSGKNPDGTVKDEADAVDEEKLRKQIEELILDEEKEKERENTEAAKAKKTKKAKKGKKKK